MRFLIFLKDVLAKLREAGIVTGWRDELYPVTAGFYDCPVFLLERAAATHFGADYR